MQRRQRTVGLNSVGLCRVRTTTRTIMEQTQQNARSTVLSSCHVFCTVQRHTRCIDVIFSDCHRYTILGIRWSDRVTNNEALQRADMPSIETMFLSRQLTWTGHVVRMNDDSSDRQSEMLEDRTYATGVRPQLTSLLIFSHERTAY